MNNSKTVPGRATIGLLTVVAVSVMAVMAACGPSAEKRLEAELVKYCAALEDTKREYDDDVLHHRERDGGWWLQDTVNQVVSSWPREVIDLFDQLPASDEALRIRSEEDLLIRHDGESIGDAENALMARILERDGDFRFGVYSRSAARLGVTLPRCDVWFDDLAYRIQAGAKAVSLRQYVSLFDETHPARPSKASPAERLESKWAKAYAAWLEQGPHLTVVQDFLAELHALPIVERCKRFPKALRDFYRSSNAFHDTRHFRWACENAGLDYDW